MTSENKIALIIAFSVLMVVGVLISDHFSIAREARLQGVEASETPDPPAPTSLRPPRSVDTSSTGLISSAARERTPTTTPIPGVSYPQTQSPEPSAPAGRPIEIRQGGSVTLPIASALTPAPRRLASDDATSDTPRTQRQRTRAYLVRENDTLFDLAARFLGDGTRWRELRDLNRERLAAGGILRSGVEILVPVSASQPEPSRPVAQPAPTRNAASSASARTYTVESGDALSLIARDLLGSSKRMDEIIELNKDKIDDPDDIRIGMTLRLPPR